MPIGFYYSPPDMHHPAYRDTSKPVSTNWKGEPQRPEWPLYLSYMRLQLTELLTRYGDVCLIWFDGLNDQAKYDGGHTIDLIHGLQPATLVNNRIGLDADYETPEQFIPKAIPTRGQRIVGLEDENKQINSSAVPKPEDFRLWETCMTINETWAYNKNDLKYKSSEYLIRGLIEVVSRGRQLPAERRPHSRGHHSAGVSGAPVGYRQVDGPQRRFDLRHHLRTHPGSGRGAHHRQGPQRLCAGPQVDQPQTRAAFRRPAEDPAGRFARWRASRSNSGRTSAQ